MEKVWMQDLTWEEFQNVAEKGSGVAILPVGSTEQHGPHLPLGTDTMVAVAISKDAAQKTDSVVVPPLWYGWSPHHMVLPGTITIRPEILIELIYDVMKSVVKHGLKHIILVNGHRIVNIPWLQIAAERAQRKLGAKVVIFDPAYMSRDIKDELEFGPIGHAEEIESSHMWHYYPSLYHADKAQDYVPDKKDLYHVDPSILGDSLCYVPSTIEDMIPSVRAAKGVSGQARKASREKGKAYHEHLVKRLVEVIEDLKK